MSDGEGRGGVVAELVTGAVAEIATAENSSAGDQVEMFGVPTRFQPGDSRHEDHLARSRGPGRPRGAVNRSTAAFRDYLLRRGVHPLEQLMRWALHTPDSLALELGCTRLEAFREWRILQLELAPYFAAKVAATDEDGRAVPQFVINLGGGNGLGAVDNTPPWLRGEVVENQPLGETPDPVSHGVRSHGVAK